MVATDSKDQVITRGPSLLVKTTKGFLMGTYHVLSISDDSLRQMSKDREQVEMAVGKAIYSLCADPQYGHVNGPTLERVTSAPVLNAGSAIRHAGEYHDTSFEAIVWNRGWCSKPESLTNDELEVALALMQAEKARRT